LLLGYALRFVTTSAALAGSTVDESSYLSDATETYELDPRKYGLDEHGLHKSFGLMDVPLLVHICVLSSKRNIF
jgi:hypothetical protein